MGVLIGFLLGVGPALQPDERVVQRDAGPDHAEQLATCREGILDPEARAEERQRWTELLFSYETPQARDLVVELLQLPDRPEVQRTVCEVLKEAARTNPARVSPKYVGPLIELLGADDPDLRSAAARALSEFRAQGVPEKLGGIAADSEEPMPKRLAAISALAPNTHLRDVVQQLINLLALDNREIVVRATTALGPATQEPFGTDARRWRAWWSEQSQLTEQDWLAGQLRIYRERNRRLSEQFDAYRQTSDAAQAAVTSQLRIFQRELFRALPAEQHGSKLIEWLESPLAVVQGTALSIIKARIADEGKRPEGEVLTALLRLLSSPSPTTRREVLLIVQNINDPSVVEAVLSRLRTESDDETRIALFEAVGRLGSPRAIPELIRELARQDAKPEYIREAAVALGEIARKTDVSGVVREAIVPLKQRYASASQEAVGLRSALLTAMAGVGDAAFATEFLDAIEQDDPTVLRPAIRGLRALKERSKLPRVRMLMQHGDPQVRLAAIEAVTELGREDADLEGLLARLNPAVEPNQLVREAAWRGFREFLARHRTMKARVDAAQRLRDTPDLHIAYLKELGDTLANANGDSHELQKVYERLGAVLVSQDKFGEAIVPLRQLFELLQERRDEAAFEAGLRWLEAALWTPALQDVGEILSQLVRIAGEPPEKAAVVGVVREYLDTPAVESDAERNAMVLAVLREVPAAPMGQAWNELLSTAAKRAEAKADPP